MQVLYIIMRKHSEPELRQKIDAMVEEHLNGSAFWDKFDKKVRETMDQHKEANELSGSAYGLYIKNKAMPRARKGKGLDDLAVGDGMKKKRGRPATRAKRAFDPKSATARRSAKVKEVREKYGISMIEASRKIKADNIPY